jgi:hypothetical protein
MILLCAKFVQNKNSDFNVLKHWSNLCQTLYLNIRFGLSNPKSQTSRNKSLILKQVEPLVEPDPSATDVGPRFLRGLTQVELRWTQA